MIGLLAIIKNPNPILRQKSEKIKLADITSEKIKNLCLAMGKTMKAKDGVGLAAPQIGKNIRLVTLSTKEGVIFLLNPEIVKKSIIQEWGEEGCLSFPNIFGKVKRPKTIACRYFDLSGKTNLIKAEGLMARVIQHEVDHLDGLLFIDRAKDIREIKS